MSETGIRAERVEMRVRHLLLEHEASVARFWLGTEMESVHEECEKALSRPSVDVRDKNILEALGLFREKKRTLARVEKQLSAVMADLKANPPTLLELAAAEKIFLAKETK